MTILGTERLCAGNLPMPLHIYVVSHTPGRLRFRVAPEHRQPETLTAIADTLKSSCAQIQKVRIVRPTGSVTLYYTGNADGFNHAMTSVQQSGQVVVDAIAGRSKASTQVSSTLARFNQWVEARTEGAVDLRFLVPLAFAVLALRQMLSNPSGLKTAPWYVMAWYAFDSFIKLNHQRPMGSDVTDNGESSRQNLSEF